MNYDVILLDDVREWLYKAGIDANACRAMFASGFSNLEVPIGNHLQQTIEKFLKAFLVLHNAQLKKTHDLDELAELCIMVNPLLYNILNNIGELTPFSTIYRYPISERLDISFSELVIYTKITEQVIKSMLPLFPSEVNSDLEILTDPILN